MACKLVYRNSDGQAMHCVEARDDEIDLVMQRLGYSSDYTVIAVTPQEYDQIKSALHRTKRVGGVLVISPPDYMELRRKEMPSIAKQIETLWDDLDKGKLDKNGEFYASIKAVKDKYPKP